MVIEYRKLKRFDFFKTVINVFCCKIAHQRIEEDQINAEKELFRGDQSPMTNHPAVILIKKLMQAPPRRLLLSEEMIYLHTLMLYGPAVNARIHGMRREMTGGLCAITAESNFTCNVQELNIGEKTTTRLILKVCLLSAKNTVKLFNLFNSQCCIVLLCFRILFECV